MRTNNYRLPFLTPPLPFWHLLNVKKETMSDEEILDQKKDNGNQDSDQDSEGETEEGYSSNTDYDKYSDVSLMDDTDEGIDTASIEEEEEWIEHEKRSTKEGEEK